jgi:tRNA (cytidine/uridine-2'-O-)-methyltransferase
LGFDFEEKKLRRAGLDYQDLANVSRYPDYESFLHAMDGYRIFALTTKGQHNYADAVYCPGDVLLFGSETAGLPASIRDALPAGQRLRIPMLPNNRSMNLSNAVALVSYEAWRQQAFAGGF